MKARRPTRRSAGTTQKRLRGLPSAMDAFTDAQIIAAGPKRGRCAGRDKIADKLARLSANNVLMNAAAEARRRVRLQRKEEA